MGQRLDHDPVEQDLGRESTDPIDFAFLQAQTFGDTALERELLALFVGQMRRILPSLPTLNHRAQNDTAHLLKGSARGIGAWKAARAAAAYEESPAEERDAAYAVLEREFTAAAEAIESSRA